MQERIKVQGKSTIRLSLTFYDYYCLYRAEFTLQNRIKNLPQFNNVFFTDLFMTTPSIYFHSVVFAGWDQHFPPVILNHSAKSSSRRRSRRLQRNLKSLRCIKRLLVMKQQLLLALKTGAWEFLKCTKSLEKISLLDLAKIAYKSTLEEGMGTIPTLQPVPGSERRTDCCNEEGWAVKSTKKAYRFSDKQKAYLDAKFNIGQTSGRKLDGEVVAREMRRAKDLTVLDFSTLQSSWTHSRTPPTSPALLLIFGNNYRMIAMFRPAKRKSTSRWQGIWP